MALTTTGGITDFLIPSPNGAPDGYVVQTLNNSYILAAGGGGSSTGAVPIGGVVAWLKSFTGTPALPAQFLECNGQNVTDAASPYNGRALPDLNGAASPFQPYFLRGSIASGGLCGQDTNCAAINLSCSVSLSVSTSDSFSGSVFGSCNASVSVSGSGSMNANSYNNIETSTGSTSGYIPSDTSVSFSGSGTAFVDFSGASVSGSGSGSGTATGSIDVMGNSCTFSTIPASYSVVWVVRIK